MSEPSVAKSRHFRLHLLAEGVFAAIAIDGGAAICNSGIIDLGGRTLVFDTFLTPQAAKDLRQAITEITGSTSCIVVNSHYHNDHIWGNQAFSPEAQIISSRRTRELIATAGADEFKWYSAHSAERLEALRAQCQSTNEEQRTQLQMWLGYYEGLVEALPQLTVCMPDTTFEDHLEIQGTRDTAELIAYEGGHTDHDTILHLPGAGIVFAGDLLFVGCHPYLAEGDPFRLLKALRELSRLHGTCFLPGHGPAGTANDLSRMIDYVEHCLATARRILESGDTYEGSLGGLKIPERFADWRLPDFYQANMRSLCKRLGSDTAGA